MKLHAPALGLAFSLLWGLGVFVMTWWMLLFGTAQPGEQVILSKLYLGYTVSGAGSVIGLVWGLVDGLIGGLIFAWLYNAILARLERAPALARQRGGGERA